MYAATVTPPVGTASSLRTLINAATPGQISAAFNGRVNEIQIQWVSGIIAIHRISNPVAADEGQELDGVTLLATLRSPNNNQLSLDDIFLSGATSPSCRVVAYSI